MTSEVVSQKTIFHFVLAQIHTSETLVVTSLDRFIDMSLAFRGDQVSYK